MSRGDLLRGTIMRLRLLMALFASLICSPALAQEQFVVIDVEPEVPDIGAGTIYESSEFVFVPQGVRVLLIDADGVHYIVEGRAAVAARKEQLDGFRVAENAATGTGVLDFFLGAGQAAEITAASRKLREDKAASRKRDAASLPLLIEMPGKVGADERHCIFSDQIVLRRADARFGDRAELSLGDFKADEPWPAEATELRISGLPLKEGEAAPLKFATGLEEREIEVVRLPETVLSEETLSAVATLARNNCAVQALTLARSLKAD